MTLGQPGDQAAQQGAELGRERHAGRDADHDAQRQADHRADRDNGLPAQADASRFFATASMARLCSSVGLNSITSVPAYRMGVWPGPT